ncbi:MAG: hypothetical protein QMC43_03545 [Candidatus Poseidoniaceae archaeon]|jgi:type 1 fimbria pilin
MISRRGRLLIVSLLALLFIAPALGMPAGPPWENNGNLVVETGCSCHGGGSPSNNVVVSISGIPRSYDTGQSYDFTISLQDATNSDGGFMLWDYNSGTLTPGDGSQTVTEEPGALSQSASGNDWIVTWTAPAEDVGTIAFQLVGNAVNGDGLPNEEDHWNVLSFSISAPDTTTNDDEDGLALRTISVGDYDSLFVADIDPEELEAERQQHIADQYFENGNLFYWTTLSVLLIAAVFQGEFYERKFGGGPPHLDRSLAMPQGIQRGIVSIVLTALFAYMIREGFAYGYPLVVGMLALWAIFGVYRTIVQARAEKKYTDLI